jgi:IclR family transcriptional regulator, KDG regulon repressor
MESKGAKRNLSIGKAFLIIEAMADADGPMRLQDIASQAGMHASNALRFLTALGELGYAAQDGKTLRYRLTPKFCRIGALISRQMDFRAAARPHLKELSRKFREAASLAVEQDYSAVYIDVVEGPDHLLQTLQRIGKVAPLHSTGVGKALLSGFDERRLEEFLSIKGLPPSTRKTIGTGRALANELAKIRTRGWAVDDEECESGVRCAAVPIRDHTGAVIAAMSISGPSARMTNARLAEIGDSLVVAAADISLQLGWEQ